MSVVVTNINVSKNRVSADVFVNEDKNNVWYEFQTDIEKISDRPANAFLAAFLPIAMKTGVDLEIDGEISQNLYSQMDTYQDIMQKWYPELKKINIIPQKISPDIITNQAKKTISCFTGGVDAFYTLIKNENKIDDLMYVWGFDIPLTEETFYAKVKNHMSEVAREFGKKIRFIKTNLGFEVTNKYASWGNYCYGAAIASVILLMSNEYELCFMPSCNDYSVLVPRGSHTLINHLWSCDGVTFVYDGAEAARVEKVNLIADNEIVQKHLRVCYSSNDNYNCAQCEKCIRTMVSLEALNKLDKIKTFSKPLVIENISDIKLGNDSECKFAEATMAVAIKNSKTELAYQLKKQISDYKSKALIADIKENIDSLIENQDFADISNKIIAWKIDNDTKRTAKSVFKTVLRKIKKRYFTKR